MSLAAVTAPELEKLPMFMRHVNDTALAALKSAQVGFVISMRSTDPSLRGMALREYVAEMFPTAHLFGREIADMPSVWSELRTFPDLRGATLQPHSSRRIILTLAHGLYHEAEDRTAAIEIANAIIASGRRVRQNVVEDTDFKPTQPATTSGGGEFVSEERVAHKVAMRLKDADKKFSGDLGECWMDFVDEYQQIVRDYKLNPAQKLQYLHNVRSKDAQRFYEDRVANYATTFQQAIDMINQDYNYPVRQTRVRNFLNSLRVSEFVNQGMEISLALAKVYKLILQLSRQVPVSHHGDAHHIDFLRRSVIGFEWSHEPLSRIATYNLSFQQVYGELEAALQLHKEAYQAQLKHKASNSLRQTDEDIVPVNYTGQGRYSYHRKAHYSRKDAKKFNPLSLAGCFNCDDPGHLLKDCDKPRNIARAAARKLEYLNKRKSSNAVHVVLVNLCKQLDVSGAKIDDSESDDNDAEIFNTLLISAPVAKEPNGNDRLEDDNLRYDLDFDIMEIFEVMSQNISPPSDQFHSACKDSGAQRTVIGKRQAELYAQLFRVKITPSTSGRIYRFGNASHECCGEITIRLPIDSFCFALIQVEVVAVNIPFLLDLDLLTKFKVIIDFDENVMKPKLDGWVLPIVHKHGHAYLEWESNLLYTETELRRLHRHFHYPQTERFTALIKRADPTCKLSKIHADLDRIKSTCDVCQREADMPHRFRVAMPSGECTFNRTFSLDIMKLEGRSVLNVVDRDTRFSAACFLTGESTNDLWEAFLCIWVAPYVGYPDTLAVDQGPQFTSTEWLNLASAAEVSIKPSGFESHNAIGVGERYHGYLRRIYNKARTSAPLLPHKISLALSVKAANDTAGPSGLVPSLLVFEIMPRLPVRPMALPGHVERMKALVAARSEMLTIVAKHRLDTALKRRVPNAADSNIRVNDDVLMFREKPIENGLAPILCIGF